MAVQLHVSHSATVKGAAIFAAGPYYCAGGHSWTAYYNCMTPGALTPLPALSKLHAVTEALAKEGRIDPTRHLADARVWLFSGTHDETVSPDVVNALAGYYARYVDPKQLTFMRDRPAGHAVVSADPDVKAACGVTKRPFINRWADVYRLIVLYPQTISRNGWGRDLTFAMNPKGCWDWWGYTGADYHTKAGPQIRAVKAMVDRIGEAR